MRARLLFAGCMILALTAAGQSSYFTDRVLSGERVLRAADVSPIGIRPFIPGLPGEKTLAFEVIGNTWYDTQTYNGGNLMNRVYEHPDGTIAATWMHQGFNSQPDRGSAYNYFDGSAWAGQVPHLGNDTRNGHPCYAPWGPNGEILAHYQYVAGDGVIKLLRRETKGTGAWTESILAPPDGNYSLVWHSMMTSGPNHEYIHMLALVYDDPYEGQDDALLYYRSSDGGVTWEINGVIIEGLGSGYFTAISSLKYAWANPVGNTIAFTYGFDHFDGLVFKSTNNGDTWEKIKVYESPYTPFNLPSMTPAFGCGDGSSAIALDSQGNAHVAFSRMRQIYDTESTPPGGWYFYPVTEGIIYWNESMPILDSTTVSSYTLEFLEEGGNLAGWVIPDTTLEVSSAQPNYGVGLTTGPMFGIDAEDNLFLTWAALTPEYTNGEFFFRHIYSNASFDGGVTWTGIKDLTGDFIFSWSECVFPAIAPWVDDKVRVVFQEDYTPGTGSGEENFIDFIDFPKDYFVGVAEPTEPAGLQVSACYPNPASGSVSLKLGLTGSSHVQVAIATLGGQLVRTTDQGTLPAGNHTVTIGLAGIAPGVYFCSVDANGTRVTRKLVVN